jgi:DNA (cytosine-5)-methyltransferase 1
MGAARKLQVADLFCGAGGTSTGVALACKELDYAVELLAINHWPRAIETHRKNHPWARHMCANIDAVDPREAIPGGYLDLLVASPECIWHSTARGGKPISDQKRASAWRIPEWCEKLYIRNIMIENVPEFRGWGPLDERGRPLKSKRAETFEAFIRVIESMGYRVEYRVLNSADYGAATSRRRLYILARKGNRRIPWPEATHAKDSRDLFGKLKPWRAAREIIDWNLEGQSIFTRKKSLARTTLLRIRAGLLRYGGPLAPVFVSALDAYMEGKFQGKPVEIGVTGSAEAFMAILNNNNVPKAVSEPVPTIVAGGQHVGLCQPEAFILPGRQFELNGADSIDKPLRTVMPTHTPTLVDPKAFIVPGYGERPGQEARTHDIDAPLPTTPCSPKFAVVKPEAFVVEMEHSQNGAAHIRPVTNPLPTVTTAKGGSMGVCEPFIVGAGGPTGQGGPQGVEEPLSTVITRNHRMLVTPFIVTPGGANLPNGRSVEDPLPTVMTGDRLALAVPVIVQPTHGGGDSRRCSSIDAPLPTQPCSNRHALATPVIVQVNHGGGESGRIQPVDEPLKAATTHNGHALVEPSIAKFYGEPEKNVASVAEPCPTVTCKDRFGLVEPVITRIGIDIRFRMFKTHELARAMGFEKYQFTGNSEEVTRQIGNAVEVNQAKALVGALLAK